MTTRREFVRTAAAATAAAAVPEAMRAHAPRVERLDRIGVQLYTVRTEMAKSVEATLERVAAIGYREVEFAGYYDREPAALRATLDRLGLSAPACHVALEALDGPFDATAAAARALGHRWMIVPSLAGRFFQSVAALRELAARFNAIGRRARDAGLRYGFHNHNAEFRPVEGAVPMEILLAETDPALVDFEMDLYWITQAGADPLAWFAKHPGRFRLVHVKDSAGAPQHEMRDVGAGTMDWKALFARRRLAGIEHFIVEHDRPADPFASVTASYQYLKALEF